MKSLCALLLLAACATQPPDTVVPQKVVVTKYVHVPDKGQPDGNIWAAVVLCLNYDLNSLACQKVMTAGKERSPDDYSAIASLFNSTAKRNIENQTIFIQGISDTLK